MKYLISIIPMVITAIIIVIYYERKIKKLKEQVLNPKTNKILNEILKLSTKREEPIKAAEKIVIAIRKYFEVNYCTVYINKNNYLEILFSNVEEDSRDMLQNYNNKIFEVLEYDGQIKQGKNVLSYPSAQARNIKYSYFIPLRLGEEVIGAIHIENREIKNMDKIEKEFFNVVMKNISIVFQNMLYLEQLKMHMEQLRIIGLKDGLTGLYNKRYADQFILNKIQNNIVFTIAMVDVDFFKKYNDKYGHLHGDKVLIEVGKFVKSKLSSKDEVMRWGGEEFMIYLEGMKSSEAFSTIDDIREGLSKLVIPTDDGISTQLTASFGIACYPDDAKDLSTLSSNADKALYISKETGRNKVTIYYDTK